MSTFNLFNLYTTVIIIELSVLKADADYGGLVQSLKPSSSGYLTSASECMLRAAKMEDNITECSVFNEQTLTEGFFLALCNVKYYLNIVAIYLIHALKFC